METLRITIKNKKVIKILKDLEDLDLIEVLTDNAPLEKLSSKYAGSLSEEVAEDLNHYVNESRNEWQLKSSAS